MKDEYDLDRSAKRLGRLCPILKDKHGNVIDGKHRLKTDAEWESITLDGIDTPQKLELARLASNYCRRQMPQEEVATSVKTLIESGLKPEQISEMTGIHLSTVYRHMPQDQKKTELAEKQKEGWEKKSFALAKPPENKGELLSEPCIGTCEYCGVATSDVTSVPVLGKPRLLCARDAHEVNLGNGIKIQQHFKNLNGEAEKPKIETKTTEPEKDKWEHRKAQMQPQHSKIETLVLTKLEASEMRPVLTDRVFPIQTTTPDFYFPRHNLAIYLDGPAHEGREDRDEKLRDLLVKRHGVKVVSIKYKSERDAEAVLKEVLKHG